MTIGKKLLLGALSLGLAGYVACTDANTNNTPVKSKYDVTPDEVKPIKWNHKSIAFVIDTSGSMNDKLNSKRKIDAAKETLLTMLKIYNEHNNKNNDIEAGLFCFNGSKVETLNPITKFNYSRLEKLGANVS
ncbi:MAG: VWA domain-containing protein, partial [Nanoarchaeota archaeon]|nr:VWA domain-containing protein [Nanoarchaeota archaeon]